jgi:hypothetical protein
VHTELFEAGHTAVVAVAVDIVAFAGAAAADAVVLTEVVIVVVATIATALEAALGAAVAACAAEAVSFANDPACFHRILNLTELKYYVFVRYTVAFVDSR